MKRYILSWCNTRNISLHIFFLAATFFSGCVKDFPFHCEDLDHLVKKANAVVVHNGESIQSAVDAASSGQIIVIEAGIYWESITVNKAGIQLIGSPCGGHVIIANPGDEENGITVLDGGDGFVLKNVTIKNFKENGVFLVRVENFIISKVITINNGEYGLFPVRCKNGLVEFCSATGHTDTGIYIGLSEDVKVKNNVVFANVNGLEIENSSNIVVSQNYAYDNVAGLLIILLPGLPVKTSANIWVTHNLIIDNNHVNFADPEGGFEAFVPSGSGILLVGADNATLKENKVTGNKFTGIATVSTLVLGALAGLPPEAFADIEPNPDGARIIENIVKDNGTAPPAGLPLPGVDLLWDGSGTNNCWKGNIFNTSFPSPLPVCSD